MIVLKHLARDFDIDPYALRMKLRKHFGIRRRWRWDPDKPEDQAHLEKVRKFLTDAIADAKRKS